MTTPADSLLWSDARRFGHSLKIDDHDNVAEELATRYRLLLDTSRVPIIYFDRDGRFLFVGRQAAEHLGDEPENIVGKTVFDFFPQALADEYIARFRAVVDEQEEKIYEDDVELPDGRHWFWSVLNPLNAHDGTPLGVQIVSHEITKKKQAEQELEGRFQFEQLVANVTSQLVDISVDTADAAMHSVLRTMGIFLQVHRSLLMQFTTDYSALNCTHEWHIDDIAPARDRLQGQAHAEYPWIFHKFLSGESVVVPRTSELPDAATAERETLLSHHVASMLAVPIRLSGRTAGVLCFDVLHEERPWADSLVSRIQSVGQVLLPALARVETERELQSSRHFAQSLTEASPHIVYVFDITLAKCVYISSQVERDLGRTPQDVYEMTAAEAFELLHPDDVGRFPAMIARWSEEAVADTTEELLRLRHVDGSWRWFSTRDRVFQRNEEGIPTQLIGTMRDVTGQRQAEEELRQHREKLIHVARLSSIGEMVASIAHEIGQPLYSILNYAKASQNVLAAHDSPDLAETREWLHHIEGASSRAGDIVRRFREFARRSTTKLEPTDLRLVVRDASELLGFELREHHVELRHELPDMPLIAKVDRVQLLQLLVNLIQNATDAMTDISLGDRVIELRAIIHEEMFQVSVADRGVGLPDDVPNFFESFVSTKPNGLGIGLAISRTIIENHGGRLWAESPDSGGTVFRFTLPISKESAT